MTDKRPPANATAAHAENSDFLRYRIRDRAINGHLPSLRASGYGANTMDAVRSHVKATDVIAVDRQRSVRLQCSVKSMWSSRARNGQDECRAGDGADFAGAGS